MIKMAAAAVFRRISARALNNSFYVPSSASAGRHCMSRHTHNAGPVSVSQEVAEALKHGRPVVALESTIITHGMPRPHNLSTAQEVENIVRHEGAVPATVAVLKGVLKLGLEEKELERLALDESLEPVKISRRDLSYAAAMGLTGGTTVSGTMLAAHWAGVPVFVTGGIGGVHRGVTDSWDISADLRELGRTKVVVVSAGVKSILDIGKTLEYLETEGVPVMTYGESRDFPAFFTRTSGFLSPYSVATPDSAANVIDQHMKLPVKSGMLIAVPILGAEACVEGEVEQAIQKALEEIEEKGITGIGVTPFILERVNQITEGKSLQANVALIRNNARVGAQIACALAKRTNSANTETNPFSTNRREFHTSHGVRSTGDSAAKRVPVC